MKEVCSCLAKFDTLDELYQHINAEMETDYSPADFEVPEDGEMTTEQIARLSVLLSSPHHGFTMSED